MPASMPFRAYLLGAATLMYGPEPSFIRPAVYRISVAADTVWFCSEIYPSLQQTTFAFARSSREWRRLASVPPQCEKQTTEVPVEYRDTVRLAPRLVSIAIRPAPNADGAVVGRSYLRVQDSVSGRRIDLKPVLTPARVRKLIEQGVDIGDDTVATYIRSIASSDTLVWIGLSGGFAEGMGNLGGIYKIDRRSGAYDFIINEKLGDHSVTGLASSGNWLWAATENPAEYGPYGDAGLMRMDLRTGAWKSYTDSTSALPDAWIRQMVSDGRILAIATERGLAVIELATVGSARDSTGDEAIARWNTRFFVPSFAGDSMMFELGTKADAPAGMLAEAPFTFVQRFARPGHERLLFESLRRIPSDSLARAAYEDAETGGKAIADPVLAPTFVALLASPGEGQLVAASAIGALGPRAPETAVMALRRAFLALDTVISDPAGSAIRRSPMGRALIALGDSMPTKWARAALEQIVRSPNLSGGRGARPYIINAAAQILAQSKDPLGLTLLMSVTPLATNVSHMEIASAFAADDTPQAWGALVSYTRSGKLPRIHMMHRITPAAINDPVVGARIREMIHADLTGSDGDALMGAAQTVQRLRLAEFVPTLVDQLGSTTVDETFRYFVHEALISVTGRSEAPVFVGKIPPASVTWWKNWLASMNGKIVAVPVEAGDKALVAWRRRLPPGGI
jgi:hypothetical protein